MSYVTSGGKKPAATKRRKNYVRVKFYIKYRSKLRTITSCLISSTTYRNFLLCSFVEKEKDNRDAQESITMRREKKALWYVSNPLTLPQNVIERVDGTNICFSKSTGNVTIFINLKRKYNLNDMVISSPNICINISFWMIVMK